MIDLEDRRTLAQDIEQACAAASASALRHLMR
jgi:hypothetical protein